MATDTEANGSILPSVVSSSPSPSSSTTNDDEALRKLLKPNPSVDEVLLALRRTYPGVSISIVKELDSYDDRNFCVSFDFHSKESGSNSERFLLLAKVFNGVESSHYIDSATNPSEKMSSVELYDAIFTHLSRPEYGVCTSKPYDHYAHTTRTGDTTPSSSVAAESSTNRDYRRGRSIHIFPVTSAAHSPRPLVLQILHWVPGRTMASLPSPPSVHVLVEAGRYLGRVCIALDWFTTDDKVGVDGVDDRETIRKKNLVREAANRYHAWDGRHTADLEPFVPYIKGEERQSLIRSVLESFRKDLAVNVDNGGNGEGTTPVPVPPGFRTGVTMADFNDENIIMDEEGKSVAGLIDFGDTTLSWRVLDISVAMAYATISSYGRTGRALSAAAAVLRGFHSIYPLTRPERRFLRTMVASRLACSATLGAYSQSKNPDNQYLGAHSQPAWKALEVIWNSGDGENGVLKDAIERLFDVACDGCSNGNIDDGGVECGDLSFLDSDVVNVFGSIPRTTMR